MLELLIKGLTCYRLANLITQEDGPYGILAAARSDLGVHDLDVQGKPDTELGKMLSCPYCLGVTLALILTLLPYKYFKLFYWWLGIAGLQFGLQRITGGVND